MLLSHIEEFAAVEIWECQLSGPNHSTAVEWPLRDDPNSHYQDQSQVAHNYAYMHQDVLEEWQHDRCSENVVHWD